MNRRRFAAGLGTSLLISNRLARAQQWPTRTVTIVVAVAAGGITDIVARMVAPKLAERLGQPVIVENRPGAAQAMGSEHVARSAPDGYTLIMGTISSHAINAALYKHLRYSIVDDFAPISQTTSQPLMLVVHPSVAARSVAELVGLLKANPGRYTFGSAGGAGTSGHLSAELFMMRTGTAMVHVPYKGSGPMNIDLVGGQIQLAFDNLPTALAQVKAGRLRGLAVTSAARVPQASDVPAIAEFLPGFEVTSWQGLFAPAATPPAVLDRIALETRGIMHLPEVRQRLLEMGATPVGSARNEFAAFVRSEIERWADVVSKAGVKVEGS